MIDHMYVKNYKAFHRENIQLGKNTLLIGTNQSGKTTVLEALDLFFNDALVHTYIRDTSKDVIIELHINDQRYRKVYNPPYFNLNYEKCIGNMLDLHQLRYLYIPNQIEFPKLLNDILSINHTKTLSPNEKRKIVKTFDYIDSILGNNNYPIFEYRQIIRMDIHNQIKFSNKDLVRIISNISHHPTILGIDNIENHFNFDTIDELGKYMVQTIYTTNNKQFISKHKHYVSALYKGNKQDDFDTIKKRLKQKSEITYLLVEGKYDVNWYETALRLLGLDEKYVVIPCGGYGNIRFVQNQLAKEGYRTKIMTDGDVPGKNALKREIVELYADPEYVNKIFHTHFSALPRKKEDFFRAIGEKDDTVKHVLSSWARKHLTLHHPFVQEVKRRLIDEGGS